MFSTKDKHPAGRRTGLCARIKTRKRRLIISWGRPYTPTWGGHHCVWTTRQIDIA